MKHNFGAKHRVRKTFRIDVNLVWTHGTDPTDAEARAISEIVSTTGPHTVRFRCPYCDKAMAVLGRDMGIGPAWIPVVTLW